MLGSSFMACENASDLGNLLAMFEAVGEHSKRQGPRTRKRRVSGPAKYPPRAEVRCDLPIIGEHAVRSDVDAEELRRRLDCRDRKERDDREHSFHGGGL